MFGRFGVGVIGLAGGVSVAGAGMISIQDGSIGGAGWAFASYEERAGGVSAGSVMDDGGDAYLRVRNNIASGGLIVGAYLNTAAVWDPSGRGLFESIDFSIDYRYVTPFPAGDGQAFGLIAMQDGRLFYGSYAVTGSGTTFSTFGADGVLAADFIAWDGGTGLDASGGVITFGFYTGNSSTGTPYSRTADYDNFSVTVVPSGSVASVLLGAGMVGARRRRS